MKKTLSQKALMSALHYNPETGVFTYINGSKKKKPGREAGNIKTQGYREIHVNGGNYYAHRLAFLYMTGSFPEELVDHINGVRADNRWCNLRPATYSENNRNARLRKDNTSGVKGVCWDRVSKKWFAYISLNKKRHGLGQFETLDEAAAVVAEVRKQLHGAYSLEASQTTTTNTVA
jgi:hypothetical protein